MAANPPLPVDDVETVHHAAQQVASVGGAVCGEKPHLSQPGVELRVGRNRPIAVPTENPAPLRDEDVPSVFGIDGDDAVGQRDARPGDTVRTERIQFGPVLKPDGISDGMDIADGALLHDGLHPPRLQVAAVNPFVGLEIARAVLQDDAPEDFGNLVPGVLVQTSIGIPAPGVLGEVADLVVRPGIDAPCGGVVGEASEDGASGRLAEAPADAVPDAQSRTRRGEEAAVGIGREVPDLHVAQIVAGFDVPDEGPVHRYAELSAVRDRDLRRGEGRQENQSENRQKYAVQVKVHVFKNKRVFRTNV